MFPFSMTTPARFAGPVPDACDVLVIGGGVLGVAAARELAARGQKVVLCEKGRIAAEQSSRNWGWIRQQGRDLAELPIMMESLHLWQGLAARLPPDLGFAQTGVLYLARTPREMADYAAWADLARAHGLQTQLLGQEAVQARCGAGPWIGALETPTDARAEPWRAVPLMADLAAAEGVILREGCAVRALDVTNGAVTGVFTEQGRIGCGAVLLAGGAWSSLLLQSHGLDIPQLSVRSSVGATHVLPQPYAGNAADDRIGFRARADGGYSLASGFAHDLFFGPDVLRHARAYWKTWRANPRATGFAPMAPRGFPDAWGQARRWGADEISPFERTRILNPAPNMRHLKAAARDFAAALPHLGHVSYAATWAGMIDMMPDVVPIIDATPLQGLVLGTGLSGHGFGIGPGFGRVLADLILGRAVGHDLHRFRFARFSDGSPITLGPAL